MTSTAIATASASSRADRYRESERRLWQRYGLQPRQRFLELGTLAVRLRVLEFGSGRPALFVHGTVGPGAWAPLLSKLPGRRSIVLERPGWGLSSALDFSGENYGTLVARVLEGVLDALELERADVVGGSIGNVWALRLASECPARVGRIVLLGGGPIVSAAGVPGIIRLLASPAGALMLRLPERPGRVRMMLRKSGHGATLDAGRISDEFVEWRVAVGRETESMRHEREMVRAIVNGKSYRPGLTFEDAELAAIQQPTLHVYGTADPVGSVKLWSHVSGRMPDGRLSPVDGGHMPWLDDSTRVAEELGGFLDD